MKTVLATFSLGLLLAASNGRAADLTYSNPVMAGDYPDPSVIRVGKDFWATATSSEWGPQFPLLHSKDLVNWEITGSVFTNRPAWAGANFWAPEISEWRGRYFIYYVARKKGGPLSIACATADKPDGPYIDHGPFVSQADGSIDPVPVTDEKGERWLVWKEDGNSRRQPTPLWAQQLDESGTKLIGEKHELFHNDQPWEGAVVEGPFILNHDGYFYLFYSGNGCCGANCNYAMGVARAKALLGPWEKNERNPILTQNAAWKCPGHGSIVTDEQGRHWLVYHAYNPQTFIYTGREMLLDEVTFGTDGWPQIHGGQGPSATAPSPLGIKQEHKELSFVDEFDGGVLHPGWTWPQDNEPLAKVKNGKLLLMPTAAHQKDALGATLARLSTSGDYTASVVVDRSSLKPGVAAGLAAMGDMANAIGIAVADGNVAVWQRQNRQHSVITALEVPPELLIHLRMTVTDGNHFQFAMSGDGRSWKSVGATSDGGYRPPWDRMIRIALTCGGAEEAGARFGSFRVATDHAALSR